jgi:D-alanine-D-alanine ligase
VSNERIGVIMGGPLAGLDRSLRAGERVSNALAERGHDVIRIVVKDGCELIENLRRSPIDVAVLTLASGFDRDSGTLGALGLMGVAHTGSTPLGSALASDRLKSKELFRLHNLPTCPHYLAASADRAELAELHGSFGYPVLVRPRRVHAAVDAIEATDFEELQTAVAAALCWDREVLVERHVEGTRLEVGLLHGRLLGVVTHSSEGWRAPALNPTRLQGVLNFAMRASEVLECGGAVTVQMLVTEGGNEYVLEVNATPSLDEGSQFVELAARAGYEFGELCESLVAAASEPFHSARSRSSEARAGRRPAVEPRRKSASSDIAATDALKLAV